MINKDELYNDIEHIYKETDYAIVAKVKTVQLGSNIAVISKVVEGERYYVSSLMEADAYCRALEPIPQEIIDKKKEIADSLVVEIRKILKEKPIKCESHVYDYNNVDHEYGLPCVKVVLEDDTTVFLGNRDIKYKVLEKMHIEENEINAIAKTLAKFYRKPISVIKDGLSVRTYRA